MFCCWENVEGGTCDCACDLEYDREANMINVEQTVAMVRQIEQRIAEEEKAFKEKMKPLNTFAEEMRVQLLDFLNATGQRNAKTNAGTAYIADKESFKVEDQSEFKRHVIGTESWEMIVWAVNRTAAKEFEKTEGALPPGIHKTVIREVRVLAPERKRTTSLKVVGGNTVPEEGAPMEELMGETGFD